VHNGETLEVRRRLLADIQAASRRAHERHGLQWVVGGVATKAKGIRKGRSRKQQMRKQQMRKQQM
jgi:hypothetical protein